MRFLQFSILVLLLSTSAGASANNQAVGDAADSLIALLLDTDAAENRKARQIHYVKDQAGMALVFFTVEGFKGGNNYTFYLGVFEPIWKFDPKKGEAQQHDASNISKYRLVGYLPVGGKGWRSVDFSSFTIEKRKITLQTKEYAGNDPMCCPSKTGTAIYRIEDKQLIELKPNQSFQHTSALTRLRGGGIRWNAYAPMNLDGALGVLGLLLYWRMVLCLAISSLVAFLLAQLFPWLSGIQGIVFAALGFLPGVMWEEAARPSPNPSAARPTGTLVATLSAAIVGATWGAVSSMSFHSALAGAVVLVGAAWVWFRFAVAFRGSLSREQRVACLFVVAGTYLIATLIGHNAL
jgi:hypothetical protein